MDSFGIILCCFLIVPDFASALDHSLITVSDLPSVSGVVFLTGPKGQYQFNFTEATEACLSQNLTLATRDRVQRALDRGLETCRFGWISEKAAVVPRLTSLTKCGSGKTGVVTWYAPAQQRFGAWCFNASDSGEAEKTTNMAPQILTTAFKTLRTTTFTAATTTTLPSTTEVKPSFNPTKKPLTTTRTVYDVPPWIQTSVRPKTSFTPAPPQTIPAEIYFTLMTTSVPGLTQSPSAVGSTSTARSNGSSELTMTNSVSSGPLRPRVLSTALIVLCIIILVLSAGGAVFYYRLSERSVWSHAPQKDEAETEMCRQTCSELELNCQEEEEEEEEEEEADRKNNSEVMLYINPDTRMD